MTSTIRCNRTRLLLLQDCCVGGMLQSVDLKYSVVVLVVWLVILCYIFVPGVAMSVASRHADKELAAAMPARRQRPAPGAFLLVQPASQGQQEFTRKKENSERQVLPRITHVKSYSDGLE